MFISSPGRIEMLKEPGWLFRDRSCADLSLEDILDDPAVKDQFDGRDVILFLRIVGDGEDEEMFKVCLIGLYREPCGDVEVWMLPHENIATYGWFVHREIKKWINWFIEFRGHKTVYAMIDGDNKKFKRFAKLAGFVYSQAPELNDGIQQRWDFTG